MELVGGGLVGIADFVATLDRSVTEPGLDSRGWCLKGGQWRGTEPCLPWVRCSLRALRLCILCQNEVRAGTPLVPEKQRIRQKPQVWQRWKFTCNVCVCLHLRNICHLGRRPAPAQPRCWWCHTETRRGSCCFFAAAAFYLQ